MCSTMPDNQSTVGVMHASRLLVETSSACFNVMNCIYLVQHLDYLCPLINILGPFRSYYAILVDSYAILIPLDVIYFLLNLVVTF